VQNTKLQNNMEKGILRSILIFTLFVSSCKNQPADNNDIIRKVKVEKVSHVTEILKKDFSGILEESREVNLAFRVAGPIQYIYIKEGSFVKAGELIAEIDSRDYQVQVDVAQAQYDQVSAETKRVKELYNRKSIADKDYEKAISGEKLITAQLKHANDQLKDTKLFAPFSGYIQEINFEEGEMINTGMPFASLIDLNKLRIEVDIPSSLFVLKNDFVSFTCKKSGPDSEELPLKLVSYNVKANANQLYKLFFQVDPKLDKELKPGMSIQVFIRYKNSVKAALSVPLNAVFYENDNNYVWIYNPNDSIVIKTEIETGGFAPDGNLRVLSGLTGQEIIVVAGVNVLKEEQKVIPIKPVTETNVGGLL
jgi:RND family efflux transporter MFP subunit